MVLGRDVEIGGIYGRWTVLKAGEKRGSHKTFVCKCKCGVVRTVLAASLKNGCSQSCGCLIAQKTSDRVKKDPPRLKHGLRRDITYNCWQCMVSRCLNKNDTNYHRYGGRGVTVCSRWSDPDKGLLNFIEDLGKRPSKLYSIDRIDSTKGYSPYNCRWATRAQQNQNVKLKKGNTSGYKGVTTSREKWKSEIRGSGTRIFIGCYDTKEEAAYAYNVASQLLHGEFSQHNGELSIDKVSRIVIRKKVKSILKEKRVI